MSSIELYNAYRQMSDNCYLDQVLQPEKPKLVTLYVVMNQIHSNPEHVTVQGVYLEEDKAKKIAQDLEFAWVDEHMLHV